MTESQTRHRSRGNPDGVDLTDPQVFSHWTVETIRFQDVDRYDHVNNVAYAVYSECARLDLVSLAGFDDPGGYWVIVRLAIDYLAETRFPGEIRVGSGILSIGRSSLVIGQGMFNAGRCVARAECVVVWMAVATRRPAPLPEVLRRHLQRHGLPSGTAVHG